MYMAGIYLSVQWTAICAALGALGGILMGASTYFLHHEKNELMKYFITLNSRNVP